MGSLRVTLSVTSRGSDTDGNTSFVFDTINNGTTAAPDALALLQIQRNTPVSNLLCDIAGVPCVARIRQSYLSSNEATYVESTQPLLPGARLRITGQIDTPYADLLGKSAASFGFAEMDLRDNSTQVSFERPIFADSFD